MIASTIEGINLGSASAIPRASATTISIAASIRSGKFSIINSATVVTK